MAIYCNTSFEPEPFIIPSGTFSTKLETLVIKETSKPVSVFGVRTICVICSSSLPVRFCI